MKFMFKNLMCIYLTLIFLSLSILSLAQIEEEPPAKPATASASQVYLELFGPGVLYSINYDTRFGKKEKGLGMRAGFGATFAGGDGAIVVPVGLNYIAGRQGNYFEAGAGATLITGETLEGEGVYGYLTMGYRRQPYRKKGLTWRASFTPLFFFEDGFTLIPWAGFSMGYRF
jgi:hypothetical protein